MFFNVFFKVLFVIIVILVAFTLLGQFNYNASLYKTTDNAFEYIVPKWDWGHPKFYIFADEHGFSTTVPDDMEYRFYKEKFDKAEEDKNTTCKAKGDESPECDAAYTASDEAKERLTSYEKST